MGITNLIDGNIYHGGYVLERCLSQQNQLLKRMLQVVEAMYHEYSDG